MSYDIPSNLYSIAASESVERQKIVIMDEAIARLLLKDLLLHLPNDTWLLVRQPTADDIGIAKALGRSCGEIDALLINTGICKETAVRIAFTRTWQTILTDIDNGIHIGNINHRQWYIKIGDGGAEVPAKQKDRVVLSRPALPRDIIQRLQQSNKLYDKKKNSMILASKLKEQNDNVANAQRAKINATIDKYPMVAHAYGATDEMISLKNNNIRQFSNELIPELVQLHREYDQQILFKDEDGNDITLIPVSKTDMEKLAMSVAASKEGNVEVHNDVSTSKVAARTSNNDSTMVDASIDIDLSNEEDDMNDDQTVSRKRSRSSIDRAAIRTSAAEILAPRYTKSSISNVEDMDWETTNKDSYSAQQTRDDAKDIRAMLLAIHRGDPTRTAVSLNKFLSDENNKVIKDKVIQLATKESTEEDELKDHIIGGIKDSIKYHTTGRVRRWLHEMFVNLGCKHM